MRDNGQVVKLSHIYGTEVGHNKDFSIIFYSAFYVKFQADIDKSGFHELKRYYQKPINVDQDSLDTKFYLSNGTDELKVDEIEVFKVIGTEVEPLSASTPSTPRRSRPPSSYLSHRRLQNSQVIL